MANQYHKYDGKRSTMLGERGGGDRSRGQNFDQDSKFEKILKVLL